MDVCLYLISFLKFVSQKLFILIFHFLKYSLHASAGLSTATGELGKLWALFRPPLRASQLLFYLQLIWVRDGEGFLIGSFTQAVQEPFMPCPGY